MAETSATDVSRKATQSAAPADGDAETAALFTDALCAIDGSPGGFAAVEQAARLTGPGGHITLLVVTSFRSAGASRSPEIGPLRAKEILDRAEAIAEQASVRTTIEVDPAAPPAEVILEWAGEHDLLAMGAPSTPWPAGLFAGGPTASAVDALRTPLLAARPPASEQTWGEGAILVASDGLDGSEQLVELAARLGKAQAAAVHLLHATTLRSHRRRERIAEQGRVLEQALGGASSVRIESGSARAAIAQAARDVQAHLIVMSSRRLHGPRAIGSVSRHTVHKADSSVLLIPPNHLAP
jgi:nucleotide-binding universal stress UspA family protein